MVNDHDASSLYRFIALLHDQGLAELWERARLILAGQMSSLAIPAFIC